jgi:hypothetical protein
VRAGDPVDREMPCALVMANRPRRPPRVVAIDDSRAEAFRPQEELQYRNVPADRAASEEMAPAEERSPESAELAAPTLRWNRRTPRAVMGPAMPSIGP